MESWGLLSGAWAVGEGLLAPTSASRDTGRCLDGSTGEGRPPYVPVDVTGVMRRQRWFVWFVTLSSV